MIFNYRRRAKQNSYKCVNGKAVKRSFNSIAGIVIHYTSGTNDTAKNNADYFATGNERYAGAHYFIDRKGNCAKSVYLSNIAYSVGKMNYEAGAYYEKLNNTNTVSIELCDIVTHAPSEAQLKKLDKLVAFIAKKCPNVKYIVRHYDIVKKDCPHRYVADKKAWALLQCHLKGVLDNAMRKYHKKEV